MTKLPGLEASTGSLGQGLSVGLGFALGARLRGETFHTFVMIGDGELQEGMIWEALHIAPRYRLGNLTAILDWNGLQQFGWPLGEGEENRGDKRDPWAGVDLKGIFERLGWRVLETDGHDYSMIIPALEQAKSGSASDQPTLILAHTIKGKGVQLTEGKYEWHSKVPTHDQLKAVAAELGYCGGTRVKAQRDVFGDTLVQLARTNPNVLVLDADLANSTKADTFARARPEQFFEMGIAEQNMVGVAAGLTTLGFIPWLSSFAVFFTHRAVDPIRMLVAQTHANVKIGAAYSGLLTGYTGKTHQDIQDLAIMRAMPGMTVLAPGDEFECESMIRWATDTQGPVYLRLSREAGPALFNADYGFSPGRTYQLHEGTDILLISTGTQTARCMEAAESLRRSTLAPPYCTSPPSNRSMSMRL